MAKAKDRVKATVTPTGAQEEWGDKRCYVPESVLTAACPKCGRACVKDYNDNYLSYPPMNLPFMQTVYCEGEGEGWCGHAFEVELILKVSLEIAKT